MTARRSTIEDFLAAFADATGADLAQFKLWYSQAGTPEVTAKGRYDTAARTYSLTLTQSLAADARPERASSRCTSRSASAWSGRTARTSPMPASAAAAVDGDVIHLTKRRADLRLHRRLGAAGPVAPPRLLGAGEALASTSAPDDLLFLLRTDADPFNRWQAAQTPGQCAR